MNALVRQIAALSVLWAMCELLLPEGRYQPVVRMTASLLVISALLTTVSGWLGQETNVQPVFSMRVQQAAEEAYQRTAVTAMANQLEHYCVRMAQRAGYQAQAVVYMTMDGALAQVQLTLGQSEAPFLSPTELRGVLAEQLNVAEMCIQLTVEEL